FSCHSTGAARLLSWIPDAAESYLQLQVLRYLPSISFFSCHSTGAARLLSWIPDAAGSYLQLYRGYRGY
ncbi:hypothetical protein ABET08_01165, partial [Bacillus subtilis]